MRPRLVLSINDAKTGVNTLTQAIVSDKITLDAKNLEIVKLGMIDVTLPGGTAASVGANAGYSIAAKTGTAQVIGIKQNEKYNEKAINERHRDHALFVAYAPAQAPTIALAVIVENGGHGGSAAGPIARKVMDYYLLGKLPVAAPAEDSPNAVKPVIKLNLNTQSANENTPIGTSTSAPVIIVPEDHYD